MNKQSRMRLDFYFLNIFVILCLSIQLMYAPIYSQFIVAVFGAAYVFYGASLCARYLIYSYSSINDMRLFFGLISILAGTLCIAFMDYIYENIFVLSTAFLLFYSCFNMQSAINMLRNYTKGGVLALVLSLIGVFVGIFAIAIDQIYPEYIVDGKNLSYIILIFNSILRLFYGIIYNRRQNIIAHVTKKAEKVPVPKQSAEDTIEFDALKITTKFNTFSKEDAKNQAENESPWKIIRPSKEELFAVARTSKNAQEGNDKVYVYAPVRQNTKQEEKHTNEKN